MIPHTIFRKQIAPAVEKLTEALRGREDHARFCGLVTRQTVHGLVIEWHDSFRYQGGHLLTVPSTEPSEEIVQEFVWRLTEWRRAAARAPGTSQAAGKGVPECRA